MIQLINFWTDLVYNGEKEFDAVPDKIKGAVMKQLVKSGVVTNDNIEDVKSAKIAEMSVACNEVITQGFDITLSDKKSHHFSLEVADQLKISKLNDRANAGITVLPYHADGESCKFYTKDEVVEFGLALAQTIRLLVNIPERELSLLSRKKQELALLRVGEN